MVILAALQLWRETQEIPLRQKTLAVLRYLMLAQAYGCFTEGFDTTIVRTKIRQR